MSARERSQAEIDATYALLVQAHEGLPAEASHLLNACALFLLATRVDAATLREALEAARRAATGL
jgi:hypothetical protein